MLSEADADNITVHARIALVLLAAEHVLPLLLERPTTHVLLNEVLRAEWSWLETRVPDPGSIYWDYTPRLMEEDTRLRDHPLLPVVLCGLDAHYYALWKADGVTRLESPDMVTGMGNDIAEVDESYLANCLQRAVGVSPQPELTKAWLKDLIAQMERDHQKTVEDVIGDRLRHDDFIVPVIGS